MGWITAFAPVNPAKGMCLINGSLPAENAHLRELLAQSGINAERLLVQAGIVATENENALHLQHLLLEELHHRSKNSIAVIMAITSQTLKNAATLEEGRIAVENRLLALSRAQNLLVQVNWAHANVTDVIHAAIEPFDNQTASNFIVETPQLDIDAPLIMPLTLSLNELCTNAVKYGALSISSGCVAIALAVSGDNKRFKLRWVEKGGPIVHKPTTRSFGTRLVTLLADQIGGDVSLGYEPDGFTYELDVPLHQHRALEAAV